MHTKAVYQAAKALARIGVAVLRFNFRGVGSSAGAARWRPGEMDDFRAGLDFMAARYPGLPLWAAGFSFGSWIALTVGVDDPRVAAAARYRPRRRSLRLRGRQDSDKPKFLIHGEFDELIPVRDVKKFYAQLREPKELVIIEAADHLFDGKTHRARRGGRRPARRL